MAHFAECRVDNNEVIRVIVVSDQDVANNGGNNSTQTEQWVKDNIPQGVRLKAQYEAEGETYPDTFWKQTYKQTSERGAYAGISSLGLDKNNQVFNFYYDINRNCWDMNRIWYDNYWIRSDISRICLDMNRNCWDIYWNC